MAAKIAEKIKKGKQNRAKKHGEDGDTKPNLYSRYTSILSVGLQISKRELYKYTVYQIRDAFERFTLKQNSDMYMAAKLAGATGLEEVANWMEDIHS